MDNFKDKVIRRNQIDDVANSLNGLALYRGIGQKNLEVRISFDEKNSTLWYDLQPYSVKINSHGWSIVASPPILFRRYNHQLPQTTPEKGGNVQRLHDFVNIHKEGDWLLFLVFVISAFLPHFPKPLLALSGSQGAGKTTPMRLTRSLIDPSLFATGQDITSTDELVRIANRQAILIFDNLSKMPQSTSDAFCRLATGETFSKRTLYTNDDETIFNVRRSIMVNGINQVITQADLLDRSIPIEVERISEEKRRTEQDLLKEFNEAKPFILGAIFDILSKAIAIFPTIRLEKLPRMADFAKWGFAIAESMNGYSGKDFIKAYSGISIKQTEEVIQASPLAQAIIWLMEEKEKWEGTASCLFGEFMPTGEFWNQFTRSEQEHPNDFTKRLFMRSPMWPKDPSSLSRQLNRIQINLRAVGIEIFRYTENNERIIKIINTLYKKPPEVQKDKCLIDIDI